MTTVLDLLSRGYFPKELPPPFYTEDFANKIGHTLPTAPQAFSDCSFTSQAAHHNLARTGKLRRLLSIPNPVSYCSLASVVGRNWPQITTLLQRSLPISASVPKPGPNAGRAVVTTYALAELFPVRLRARATSRYILRSDISRFYPSIYTHTIPWAIHTRAYAKAHKKAANLGNDLDRCSRNLQDRQTIGIPIGPDTSLIIAEIILSAVDQMLLRKLKRVPGFRHVDDFELGFVSRSEAEEGLGILQEALLDYELALNQDKTQIIELPTAIEARWVSSLRNFTFRSTDRGQQADLVRYFDLAFESSNAYPGAYVLKYAISRLRGLVVSTANWDIFQDLLLQSLMVESGTFVPVLSILTQHAQDGFPVRTNTLEPVLNSLIIFQAPLGHGSEVAWALWTGIVFGVPIDKSAANAISKMDDSVVALLALDAQSRGLIPSKLNTTRWEAHMTTEDLHDRQWLLAYEANIKGWLPSASGGDHVLADPNFRYLKHMKVEFYNSQRAIGAVPTFTPPSAGLAPLFSF